MIGLRGNASDGSPSHFALPQNSYPTQLLLSGELYIIEQAEITSKISYSSNELFCPFFN
jgi:hypothetical protein